MPGRTRGEETLKEERRTEIEAFHQNQQWGLLKKLFHFAANCPTPYSQEEEFISSSKAGMREEKDVRYGSIFSSG